MPLFNAFMTIEAIPDGGVQSLAVDPTNPDVGSSRHPGGLSLGMPDGSVRFLNASITDSIWIDMGAPPADGYLNPSSFQIIAAGPKGEAEPQLTTEPTAPEPYMSWKLENCKITSYSVHGADAFDFSQLTTEPTAPADERSAPSVSEIVVTKVTDSTSPLSEVDHNEFRIIKLVDAAADFQPELTTEPTDAGAVAGIVIAATSDNNRLDIDDGADVLTGDTFDFQPQFTTEPTAPESRLGDPITFTLTVSNTVETGSNWAMGDGSVRFVYDSPDQHDLAPTQTFLPTESLYDLAV